MDQLEDRLLPSVQVGIFDSTVFEGDTSTVDANFTVFLTETSDQEVRVDYETTDGTATSGSDYDQANGTLVFAAGEKWKTVSVAVHGDRDSEPDETFLVSLSNAVNATITPDRGQATGTILNDDASPPVVPALGAFQ